MTSANGVHRVVNRIADLPLIRGYRERRYARYFAANRDENLFRGIFESFDAAQRSAPETRPLGYDNAESASMYLDRTRKTYPTDYPVMFWLQKLLANGCTRVFDLGGHIGVSYYAYRKYLNYSPSLQWAVHDVPAVMAQGRKFAAEKDKDGHLTFCDRFDDVEGTDVLMALGSLQYLPEALVDRLRRLRAPPKHLILNLMPLHEKHSYFTLQSIGTAFCPYRITAVGEFLRSFEDFQYKLVDSWENPDKSCEIPFFPKHSLDRYHGFYFCREN